MTRSWERNLDGLRAHAQEKARETARRAEAAIAYLLKEHRPVNFKTVAEAAGISTAWLYGNETIKQRIMHLRAQQQPSVQVRIPPREQASSASKDAMIAALRQRVKKLEEENRDLKRQAEVANGLLYQQE
jgi:predicted RNase H-like nuclease (RuvC/YqgF family)